MMSLEAIACYANNLASLASKAIELRNDARNYRALGKTDLADLLEAEALEWEAMARKALRPGRDGEVVVSLKIDGAKIQRALRELG